VKNTRNFLSALLCASSVYSAFPSSHSNNLIPSCRGDSDFFARAEQVFTRHASVIYVETNPLTGSILLHYTGDLDDLVRFARAEQLFAVDNAMPSSDRALNRAVDRLNHFERNLQRLTRGAFDLNELLFIALLVASAIQLLRGRVLAPASTLLSYAATLLVIHRSRRDAE